MADESIERRRVTLLQPHQMGRRTLAAAGGGEDPARNDGDDDKRPVLPPRLLKRTRDETDAKVKGSDDDTPSKMPSNVGTAKRAWHEGEELIHTPPPLPSLPPSTPADDAANFAVPGTASPQSSPPFASSAARGEDDGPATASRGSSRHHNGKSRKVSTGVCEKRRNDAYELVKGRVPGIENPEDVTELCSFVTPTYEDPRYNLGCPFVFFPADYDAGTDFPPTNFFPKGVKEYEELFITLFGEICDEKVAAAEGKAAASVALYCSCYQGYDLGCSNELPSTPQEKDEYCEFAGL